MGLVIKENFIVDDASSSIILALRKYNSDTPLNIGTGKTHSIKEVAKKLIKIIYPEIKIKWKKKEETGIKIKDLISKGKKRSIFIPEHH